MAEGSTAPLRLRLGFPLALSMTMATGMFLLFALSVLAPFVIDDLGIGRGAFGVLSTAMFAVGGVCSLVAGRLVDELGGRTLMISLFVIAGLSWTAVASADSFLWLLPAAAGMGLAVAIMLPVITQLVAVHVPAGRRGLTMAVAQSGAPMAQLVAGALLPAVALAIGWRGALLVCAALTPLAVLAAVVTVPRGRAPAASGAPAPAAGRGRSVVLWLGLYAFLSNSGVTATTIYLPLFAHEQLGFSVTVAGLVAVVVAGLGILGKLIWGRAGERARAPQRPLLLIGLLTAVGIALIAASPALGAGLLWVGVVGFALNGMNWPVLIMLTVARETRANVSARAAGRVMMAGYLGAALGPTAFGSLTDLRGSYTASWFAVVVMFLASALLAQRWHRVSVRRVLAAHRGAHPAVEAPTHADPGAESPADPPSRGARP